METISSFLVVVIVIVVGTCLALAGNKAAEQEELKKKAEKEKAAKEAAEAEEKAEEDRQKLLILAALRKRAIYHDDIETVRLINAGEYDKPLPTMDELLENTYETSIAGINFRKNIRQYVGMVDAVLLEEPTNPHDPNAIRVEVYLEGAHLGYVPSERTSEVREFINGKFPFRCMATIDEYEDYDENKKYYAGKITIYR